MVRSNKKRKLLSWLNEIKKTHISVVRNFMKIDELFYLYIQNTNDNSMNKEGFFRIVNSIEAGNDFKNLKRIIERRGNARINKYIIVFNNECDLDVKSIKIYNTRQKIKSEQILSDNISNYSAINNNNKNKGQRNEEMMVDQTPTKSIPKSICQSPNSPLPRQCNPTSNYNPVMVSITKYNIKLAIPNTHANSHANSPVPPTGKSPAVFS